MTNKSGNTALSFKRESQPKGNAALGTLSSGGSNTDNGADKRAGNDRNVNS